MPPELPDRQAREAYQEKHSGLEYMDYMAGVGQKVAGLGEDEVQKIMSDAFSGWIEKQQLFPGAEIEIAFSRSVMLNEVARCRWFDDVIAEVDLKYDPTKLDGVESALLDTALEEIRMALTDPAAGSCRLGGVIIEVMTPDGTHRNSREWLSHNRGGANFKDNDFFWQSEAETEAIALAFDAADDMTARLCPYYTGDRTGYDGFMLYALGPQDGSLVVRIFVGGPPDEYRQPIFDAFETEAKALAEALINDGADYLKETGVSDISITFETTWDRETPETTFTYQVE